MTTAALDPSQIAAHVMALLTGVAPDIDPAAVAPDRDLRDQFDFDSMDTLHFATAISSEFGIEVAEKEYARLASLKKACDFVQEKLRTRG
jgi:acyl carrier protein